MNKEEQAFHFLLDEYMQIPSHWEDYQIIKNAIEENQQLKKQYCERTDCSGRIKDSKKYDSLQQRIDKAIEEIDKYLLTEDYCSLKCENLADTFYKLSEILKGKSE